AGSTGNGFAWPLPLVAGTFQTGVMVCSEKGRGTALGCASSGIFCYLFLFYQAGIIQLHFGCLVLAFGMCGLREFREVEGLTDIEDHRGSGNLISMPLPRPEVRGIDLDVQTRCAHYRTALDIVAIRMKCCGVYYACKECHEALADHPIEVWPQAEFHQPAVLCGACGCELSIAEYMASGHRCLHCDAPFNPGCRNHYQFYFTSAV
ncbi:MAG: CHY zinc finger protein, partial [Silvibacterium sp.]